MPFRTFVLLVCLSIGLVDPFQSISNCNLHYDRFKTTYGYSLTFHCSNIRSFTEEFLRNKDVGDKKLPLRISASPQLTVHSQACGRSPQHQWLGLLIESSHIRSMESRAFSCGTLRVLSISNTEISSSLMPDDVFTGAHQLQTIRLVHVNLKRLPSSLETLSNLTDLILDDMHSLVAYPSIEHLTHLRYLHILTSLNYFPLNYIEILNRLAHIQIVHFGSRTINIFPRELFHLNGYQLTDVSLYSENITCQTCKTDWFKTIVKTLMLTGWTNRTKDQFTNKNFHLITTTTQFYKLDIVAYCGDMRLGDEPLMVHNAPLCCNKGYFQCPAGRATCRRANGSFSRCTCRDGFFEDSYGDCIAI